MKCFQWKSLSNSKLMISGVEIIQITATSVIACTWVYNTVCICVHTWNLMFIFHGISDKSGCYKCLFLKSEAYNVRVSMTERVKVQQKCVLKT